MQPSHDSMLPKCLINAKYFVTTAIYSKLREFLPIFKLKLQNLTILYSNYYYLI